MQLEETNLFLEELEWTMKMLFRQKRSQELNRKSVFFYEKYVKNFPVSVDGAIMSFVESIYIRTVSSYHLISALLNWLNLFMSNYHALHTAPGG